MGKLLVFAAALLAVHHFAHEIPQGGGFAAVPAFAALAPVSRAQSRCAEAALAAQDHNTAEQWSMSQNSMLDAMAAASRCAP